MSGAVLWLHIAIFPGMWGMGCSNSPAENVQTTTEHAPQTNDASTPKGTLESAVEQVCRTASCSGEFARVIVWTDSNNQPTVLEHRGSIQCSHPPTTWTNLHGEQLLIQANRPVAGPDDAASFQAERDAVIGGLQESETIHCPAVQTPPI